MPTLASYRLYFDSITFGGCGRVVVWDPVPWPGKDFYRNARATDDGVKAA
ncbi:MAG: hypothetical protein O7C67_17420 [Gammaproteobacteria bacterium]|nr:hypothetical protein [Gammaproteobacteria bacterium]